MLAILLAKLRQYRIIWESGHQFAFKSLKCWLFGCLKGSKESNFALIGREMGRQVTGKLIPSCSFDSRHSRVRTLNVRYVLDVKDKLYLETNPWRTGATIRESASENNVKFWRSTNVVLSMILYMTTIGHRLSRFSKIRKSARVQELTSFFPLLREIDRIIILQA